MPPVTSMPKQERRTVLMRNQTTEENTTKKDEEMRRLKERMKELQNEIDRAHAEIDDGKWWWSDAVHA